MAARSRYRVAAGALPLVLGLCSTGLAGAPSFDCKKAAAADEKAICGNAELSALDVLIAAAFKTFKPEFRKKLDIAREINADRARCADDAGCILAVEANALETYGTVPDWVSSRLSWEFLLRAKAAAKSEGAGAADKIGQCTVTTISQISTRLSDSTSDDVPDLATADPQLGSSVNYANGISGVSYDHEETLVASKVGDKVGLCLVSVPRDCPGDDRRGNTYLGYNTRTGQSWQLPDSEHMCGGA